MQRHIIVVRGAVILPLDRSKTLACAVSAPFKTERPVRFVVWLH